MFVTMKRRFLAVAMAAVMAITAVASAGIQVSAEESSVEYSRAERLDQPSVSHTFAANELGVVNFSPVWGDKEANVASMLEYIDEAYEAGVKILLFPEMCVTGYCSSSNPNSEIYQWAVESAEPVNGPTAQTISAKAVEYGMYIIYGATETIEGDSEHAYNSAFACTPDGTVYTYQKITPVEGDWCTPGTTPVLIDAGEYGLIGLSICYDTYATPELGRYYAAMGCNLLLNPTATSRSYRDIDGDGETDDQGWEWYYKIRLESNASRDGYTVLSANLVGYDGPSNNYNFPGGSIIMRASSSGPYYYAGAMYGDEYCDGTINEDADIITGEEGLLTNVTSVRASTGSTCSNEDFSPEWYAQLYATLADEQEDGASLSYSSTVTDGPTAAVVNMVATWGDKETTLNEIIGYIKDAADQGVDILVFPETCLTGYEYQDPTTDSFEDDDRAMQVITAETIPGPTTNLLSEYAQEYGMYIILGMTEYATDEDGNIVHMYEDGVEKVYNSAAVIMPDGTIESYQKNHRAGVESYWSVPGYYCYDEDTGTFTTDYEDYDGYMFETEWGLIGVDICRDGHFYPELARYYAAQGCTILIHPTATTGGPWYRETRMASYTDRDGLAVITCNLLGGDGTYNEETDTYSGGEFASTSLIITKYNDEDGNSFDPVTGSAVDLNGTGSESEGFEERGTSPEGLEVAEMDLTGTGFSISNFNPRLFSIMYDYLATLYRDGYESIYLSEGSEYEGLYDDLYASMLDVTSYTFGDEDDDEDEGTTLPFVDVTDPDSYYYDAVEYVYEQGLITGYYDEDGNFTGLFGPSDELSRAQFATIIYRMAGSPSIEGMENVFTDNQSSDAFYYEALIWCQNVGIITGYYDSDGTFTGIFDPGTSVTREQLALMLYRYAEYCGLDVSASASLSSFGDGDSVSEFAEEAVQWAVAEGIISGRDTTPVTIAPQDSASRADAAVMLQRYLVDFAEEVVDTPAVMPLFDLTSYQSAA